MKLPLRKNRSYETDSVSACWMSVEMAVCRRTLPGERITLSVCVAEPELKFTNIYGIQA